uniref:RNA-directed RNA polymerase catalytic subunit n=1 Tax=Wuhan asiatic toad influenza virus TaxID=2116482 RepID=A0A2P1GNZ7_9ORTO|nr:PB1 [Wuhan asiatic toad influenza virus]
MANINPFSIWKNLPLQQVVSMTYPYTGCPPYSHGSGTGYSLETCDRTLKYSKDGEKSTSGVTGCHLIQPCGVLKLQTEDPTPYSNPYVVLEALNTMEEAKPTIFSEATEKLQYWLRKENVGKVAEGRQTFDMTTQTNNPAATALNTAVRMFKESGEPTCDNGPLVEMSDCFSRLLDRNEDYVYKYWGLQTKRRKVDIKGTKITKRIVIKVKKTMNRREFLRRSLTINTMTKDAERGKLKRRAIATPGVPIRLFVPAVEELARSVCSELEQSGLPVGGEEKKAKLGKTVQTILSKCYQDGISYTITADNTKWNETQSPSLFMMMCLRMTRGAPEWIRDYVSVACTLFHHKMVKLGPGIGMENELMGTQGRCKVEEIRGRKEQLNEKTKKMFENIEEYIGEDGLCSLSPGMLMGMFNMMSTVLGVCSLIQGQSRWLNVHEFNWDGLQSSDDSVVFFNARTEEGIENGMRMYYNLNKLMGMNMSTKKSYANITGTFEFTSNHYRHGFQDNLAMEIPSFVAAGVNPTTDVQIGCQLIKNSMVRGEMSIGTAVVALKCMIADLRGTYMCHRGDSGVKGAKMTIIKELWEKTSNKAGLLLADGGPNLYTLSTLHIPEPMLKWSLMDEDYKRRVFNPKNPFCSHGSNQKGEVASIMKAASRKEEMYDSVTSCHSYNTMRNRSILNTDNKALLHEERAYKEVVSLYEECFPSSSYKKPTGSVSISSAITNYLRIALRSENSGLTEDQKREIADYLG